MHPDRHSGAPATADVDAATDVPAIDVAGLSLSYGPVVAVDDVSFTVGRGHVLALLGPNGAGKTSTVEACEGFRRPTHGQVRVLGLDPWLDHDEVAPHVGVMLQEGGMHATARVGELLELFASFAAAPLDTGDLAERLGLSGLWRRRYHQLSGGEKQRLHLATAIVGRPSVVFLDEPTAGMDLDARHDTWALVREMGKSGVAVLMTTHLLDEAESLADSVVIVHHGKVVAAGSTDELTGGGRITGIRLRSEPRLPVRELARALPGTGTARETSDGEYWISGFGDGESMAAISGSTAWFDRHGATITELRTVRLSLEDVYRSVTGEEA
jgi:ABC-2 type transport system ATP-binding protein